MATHNGLNFPWEGDSYHDPAWKPKVIGQRIPIRDSYEHVTGAAQFPSDIYIPNMLHAKILFSSVAHANITAIDTSKALALPGVKAIVTSQDRADAKTMKNNISDFYLVDKVRRWGDPIAAVAAETEEIAENALDLINVTYQQLGVVLDYDSAVATGAPQLNATLWPGNVPTAPVTLQRGDIVTGFTQADMILEHDYTLGHPSILPPELTTCVASYQDNILTIWTKDQEIEGAIKQVNPVTGIPQSNIRVYHRHGSGSYSSSNALGWIAPVASLLTIKTGRPVRLETDIEYVTIQGGRAPLQLHLKVGVKKDGTITAIQGTAKDNAGSGAWTSSESGFTPASTLNLYSCPNESYQMSFAVTNISGVSQYRGYGAPQGWPIDAMMDEIAEKMGFDSLAFKKQNFPKQWDNVLSFGTWVPQTSTGMVPLVNQLTSTVGWANKWTPASSKTGTVKTGLGLGTGSKDSAMGAGNLFARVDPDGSVNVFVDAADIGQSIHTFVGQIFAEMLGLTIDKVKVYWGDSSFVPRSGQDVSSRFAMCGGNGARRTAENLIALLFQAATTKLNTTTDNMEISNGAVQVKGNPATAVTFATLVGSGGMIAAGGDSGLSTSFRGKCSMMMQYATACEAQVDTETGNINITNWAAGGDVGRAINPSIVEGQLSGSSYMMVGEALMDEIIYDPTTGVPLNTSHEDCRNPTAADIPPTTVVFVESIDPFNAFGQKGVGETSMTSQIPAILNTFANATGVRIYQTPVTPEVVLKALGKI